MKKINKICTDLPAEAFRLRSQWCGNTYMCLLSRTRRQSHDTKLYVGITSIGEHSLLDNYVATRGSPVTSDTINYGQPVVNLHASLFFQDLSQLLVYIAIMTRHVLCRHGYIYTISSHLSCTTM